MPISVPGRQRERGDFRGGRPGGRSPSSCGAASGDDVAEGHATHVVAALARFTRSGPAQVLRNRCPSARNGRPGARNGRPGAPESVPRSGRNRCPSVSGTSAQVPPESAVDPLRVAVHGQYEGIPQQKGPLPWTMFIVVLDGRSSELVDISELRMRDWDLAPAQEEGRSMKEQTRRKKHQNAPIGVDVSPHYVFQALLPRVSRAPLFALVVGASLACSALVGCNDRVGGHDEDTIERYAKARCQQLQACGCASDSYGSQEECQADLGGLVRDLSASRTIDSECLANATAVWEGMHCEQPRDAVPCNLVAKRVGLGGACLPQGDPIHDIVVHVNDCEEGLTCWNGRCVEPAPDLSGGDPCTPDGRCGSSELACISGTCTPRRGPGDACSAHDECLKGPYAEDFLFCLNDVCAQGRPEGAACSEVVPCAPTEAQCVAGRCVAFDAYACRFNSFAASVD